MATMIPMAPSHFSDLYEVMRNHDPLFDAPSFDHFVAFMNSLEGWVVLEDGQVAGMVGLSNLRPGLDVVLHGVVHPGIRGRWITRGNLGMVFGKIFHELRLPRVSGYMVPGINEEQLGPFFVHLGFEREGRIKKGILFKGKFHDLIVVGMLREDCRWL